MKKYAEAVAKEINDKHDGFSAEVIEIVKMNDEKLVGVMVRREDADYSSVNYIEGFFKNDVSVEKCAETLTETKEVEKIMASEETEKLTWDDVKNCITMRLVGIGYNTEYLKNKVYKNLNNGFAIMFDVDKENYRIGVTTDLAETLGCDYTMLACAAQTSGIGKPALCDLGESLFGNPRDLFESNEHIETSMLVLTAKDTEYGASVIYKVGVGEKIKELVGEYYLLPSSVHEWIVVPESAGIDVNELSEMVTGANKTVVKKCDLLSYGVYKWSENGLYRVA